MLPRFSQIRNWVFDLDNTLYSPQFGLFPLIDKRMCRFIMKLLTIDEAGAYKIQKQYFHDHGTTLAGLMARHDVDPHDFLDYVHDVDMSGLPPDTKLRDRLAQLPGQRLIYTNADADYASRVLTRLGIVDLFDGVFDIHAAQYQPKPELNAYKAMLAALDIVPEQSLFVEDMARNLLPAKELGMTTIWIDNASELGNAGHCQHRIDEQWPSLHDWFDSLDLPIGAEYQSS